jgi:hypothetical protein
METLGGIGKYTIRLVDGEQLRQENPDFNNYGHHDTDPKIPENEIWLDKTSYPHELSFFLLRAIYERFLYDRGLPNEQITSSAKTLETALRQQQPAEEIKVKYLTHIGDMALWLVRGDQVRKQYDPDFILGGNGYRYPWIPKFEIWVEDVLSPDDKVFTLLHELHETSLMRGGMPYDAAHEETTHLEKKLRDLGRS